MMTQSEFFKWLNPELSIDERYSTARLLNLAPVMVDEETWEHFLGCLPPMNWTRNGFCISEATCDGFVNAGVWSAIRLAFFGINGARFAAYVTDAPGPNSFTATFARIALNA